MIVVGRASVKYIAAWICAALLIALAFHFVSERITHRDIPSGDEGSWLSCAAQICRGEGFSTRWLEYQFQKPYCLPRPDDFRYPGLTLLLGTIFKITSISYPIALKACGAVFLLFCIFAFYCIRTRYGRCTALLSLLAMTLSLNQLQWNSVVYCEGLFGLILAVLLIVSIKADPMNKGWWIALGAAIGVLTMVRPNGILLSAGLAGQYLWMRRSRSVPARFLIYAALALALVVAPWGIRNMTHFGNPFHIAGGAGLLQRSFAEPVNESILSFVRSAGPLFPLKATLIGIPRFFHTLIQFEHGLCVPLLLFCAMGFFFRLPFFNAFAAVGFAVSFVASCYAAYKSYAGIRYFTPFLPFVYAYGIYCAATLVKRLPFFRQSFPISYAVYAIIAIGIIAPVFYPHRYYERYYKTRPIAAIDLAGHGRVLDSLIIDKRPYFAGRLGQLSFLSRHVCVGVQEDFDSAMVFRALSTFNPSVVALAPEELHEKRYETFFEFLRKNHCLLTLKKQIPVGSYYSIDHLP